MTKASVAYKQECDIVNIGGSKKPRVYHGRYKQAGVPSTVYALKDDDELSGLLEYFYEKYDQACNKSQKVTAARDLAMVVFGLSVGLRASDIVTLRWGELIDDDYNWRDCIRRQQQKTGKYGNFFINDDVKRYLSNYLKEMGVDHPDLNAFIFKTRQSDHITVNAFYKIIKKAAAESGINTNVGTHSLRKTFGYRSMKAHENDAMFLADLMKLLGHSSEAVTLRYCGIEDDERKKLYNDLGGVYAGFIKR